VDAWAEPQQFKPGGVLQIDSSFEPKLGLDIGHGVRTMEDSLILLWSYVAFDQLAPATDPRRCFLSLRFAFCFH
jgi:hypothetical protein